jgi:PPOX class probable F420-dependent enzyme
MDRMDLATARLRRFLEREPVIWLSTTCDDGAPHVVPTWFAWDGEAITVLSKPAACKTRNLRDDPRAMVGLGDAEDDFDVGLLEATAEVLAEPTPPELPSAFRAKYGRWIEALGLSPAEFAATYSTMIRLTPARALDWRGRYRRSAPRPESSWAGGALAGAAATAGAA